MDLNVCVLGYGLLGKTHAKMYLANKNVKKVTVNVINIKNDANK
jgi:hypothetical protein